ncbi:MAG TPA: hydantoinase/oxoprolinase family protein [Solirubrobacteraceae bacterium]|jgi:N-methylhydantoinase A
MAGFRVGVDIGGTFTDTVMIRDGEITRVKVPSTPPAFHKGLLNGLDRLEQPLSEMNLLAHGTTVGTNAIVARHGARTGLVTTKGFRDVLVLRRGDRADQFNLWWQPQAGLVPRPSRFEVDERVDYAGDVVKPLDEQDVRRVAAEIREQGLEAVAVTLINSFVNPDHEQRIKAILSEELPGVYLSISSEILPEILEYERTATTTVNAYIGPVMDRYVAALEHELRDKGYGGDVVISTSAGGVATPDIVRQVPARTVESGPAAGVMAAAQICKLAGIDHVVTFDMGGTSLDVGLIHDGEVLRTNQYMVEWGTPVRFPCVDVKSIGAGGGSIAWIDKGGSLRVGPHSAGASPGPACYGQGGTDATVTDAELVLGRLEASAFLGGEMTVDPALAEGAVRKDIGEHFGWDAVEAASGIVRIAVNNMTESLRLATVDRGYDPREFSLFALGGAGPLFAAEVAKEANVPQVVVPRHPGLTSALGLLMVDIRHDVSKSLMRTESQLDLAQLNAEYGALERKAADTLAGEGVAPGDMLIERTADVRYYGQADSINIPVPSGELDAETLRTVIASFHARHGQEYGYTMPADAAEPEIATLRVSGIGKADTFKLSPSERTGSLEDARAGTRSIYFDGAFHDTPIYDRDRLAPGVTFDGPAIVEQLDSTIVVLPGMAARVDDYENVLIAIDPEAAS